MCIICIDLTKNKLTSKEARRNMLEMRSQIKKEHRVEVLAKIWEKEEIENSSGVRDYTEEEFESLLEWMKTHNED